MKYIFPVIFVLFIFAGCSDRNENDNIEGEAVTGEEVTYSSDGTTMEGFLVYDDKKEGKRPGVLVVHEWWGLNDYARERAKLLADIGYVALAVDMYGGGKTVTHPDDAAKFSQAVMQSMDTAKARFKAGLKLLKEQPQTDTNNIAAIGYCFGGGIVLHMALSGVDLDGVVSFHGSLPTESVENPDQVKAELLVLNGEADPFSPPERVSSFKEVVNNANVEYQLISYPGAKHSFTNPAADSVGKKFDLPLAYDKEADEKSWEQMKDFFNKIFQ